MTFLTICFSATLALAVMSFPTTPRFFAEWHQETCYDFRTSNMVLPTRFAFTVPRSGFCGFSGSESHRNFIRRILDVYQVKSTTPNSPPTGRWKNSSDPRTPRLRLISSLCLSTTSRRNAHRFYLQILSLVRATSSIVSVPLHTPDGEMIVVAVDRSGDASSRVRLRVLESLSAMSKLR